MLPMYENFRLCEGLKSSEICLVVEQYDKGLFTRRFHEHVPKSRLSNDARVHLLRALVIHFSRMGPRNIVACHLNKKGPTPSADSGTLHMFTSYPEPGVLRFYCGLDTKAWSDQVIAPSKFRPGQGP